jgi:MFS family permease
MLLSGGGAFMALSTPLQLLLTLHLARIAGPSAAAAFGLVTGLGALCALLANPLGGRLSDRTAARFGRRRSWILTGAVIGCLTLATMAFATAVWQVALIWCVVQISLNFQQAATTALLADQVPPARRGTVSGLLGMAAMVAPLLGIAVVSLIENPTLQWLFVAGAGLALGLSAALLLRDPASRRPEGLARLDLKGLATTFWLNPRRHPAFGWAWLVRFLITCAYASATYTAFFLMGRFGYSEDDVAAQVLRLSAIMVVALAAASVLSGIVSDRIQRQKPFVVAGGIMAAIGLTTMGLAPSMAFVYLAEGLLGAGFGLFIAIDAALCVRMLPHAEDTAKDLGLINVANSLPQSFVPFVAPALLALGGFTALYLSLALFGILGAVLVRRLPDLGQEGDPRFAAITAPAVVPAPVATTAE